MENEIDELEEVDYKTPEDTTYGWEDRITDAVNVLIRYVKKVEEKGA